MSAPEFFAEYWTNGDTPSPSLSSTTQQHDESLQPVGIGSSDELKEDENGEG